MNHKNTYTILLLLVAALVLSWALPALVRIATTTAPRYPFVYYSTLLQRFLIKDMADKQTTYTDTDGNEYTRDQYDSLTPMLNYRQLMLANSLPDTILGTAIDPPKLRTKTVVWHYRPRLIRQPVLPLYFLYESMSGRATIEPPDDVFRLKDDIAFIDKSTNRVNVEKSRRFREKLEAERFAFPAQQVWGNLSARKPYDEGYFVLDHNGQLYHLKMVNGRPYVRDTKAGAHIDIAYFGLLEVLDKSIYGFVVSRTGDLYTLNADGAYSLTRFDIPPIDVHAHSVMLMGNLFYWMVYVTTPESCTHHVLQAGTLERHDAPLVIRAAANPWDTVASWLFPVHLRFSSPTSDYLQPDLKRNFGWSLVVSHLTFFGYAFTAGRRRTRPVRIVNAFVIILFGLPGLIASLIIK
jgi:hypothetical protein